MLKQPKLAIWSGTVFFLCTVSLSTYWFLRPNPLIGEARGMVISLRDGDGNALFDASLQDEQKCSDLSPAKLHRIWEILIEPNLKRSKLAGEDPIKLESNQTQAVGQFRYVTNEGDPWTLSMIANASAEGAKSDVVYSMLATASLFDDDGHANPNLTSNMSLAGLQRYRRALETAGIHSLMLSPGSCVSFDELEKKLKQ